MFGIGFTEMLIIAVVLLIAVGPRQLPQMMKTVGKGIREIRKAADDLRRTTGIDEMLRDDDLRNPLRGIDQEPAKTPYKLTAGDLAKEAPREGIDAEFARQDAEREARVAAQEALPTSGA
jgi:sec-independent protein translocase protein TatB